MWLVAVLVSTVGAHPYLASGEKAFEAQDYERAVGQLVLAFGVPELSRDDRRRTAELLAKSHLALGNRADAVEALARLLATDPRATVPEGGPKVREAFREAKARVYAADYVSLKRLASTPREIALELIDPWELVSEVVLFESDGGPFRERPMKATPELIRETLAVGTSRFYVVARREGAVVATLGSESAPFLETPALVARDEPPQDSRATRPSWLKWLTGGVAVASLVGCGLLFASSASDSQMAGNLAFAAQRKAADDSAIAKAIGGYTVGAIGLAAALGTVGLWVF